MNGICGQYPPPRLPATEQLERQLRDLLPVLMSRPDVTPEQVLTMVMRCARPLLDGEQPHDGRQAGEQDEPDSRGC